MGDSDVQFPDPSVSVLAREARLVKLLPPRVPAGNILRPRLLARLDWAASLPLIMVIAQGGYGKTTLLSSWATASNRPIAWVSLDHADRGLRNVLRLVLAAIRRIEPGAGAFMAESLGGAFDLTPEAAAGVLADDLLALGRELTLVLDDFHTVADADVEAMLGVLLRFPPPGLNLVISSREMPRTPNGQRMLAFGQALMLSDADMRLDLEEIAAVLPGSAASRVADVLARTGGWAAGVRAVGLASEAGGGLPQSVRAYLASDVLAGQPEDLVALLEDVAPVERVTPSLASAMSRTGIAKEEARRLFESAERSGLFVTRLDEAGGWWRIHPLLREVLEAEQELRLGGEAGRAAQLRASMWYADHGMMPEAVDLALRSGSPELAADMISNRVMEWLDSGWTGSLEWIDRLPPEDVETRPELLVARATSQLTLANLTAALATCDQVERLLDERDPERADLRLNALRWELVQIRESAANQGCSISIATSELRELMDGPQGVSRRARGYGVTLWCVRKILAGEWEEARPDVEAIATENLEFIDDFSFQTAWTLAGAHLRYVDLSSCHHWIGLARRIGDEGGHHLRMHWLANIESSFLLETGDLKGALRVAEQAIPVAPGIRFLPKHNMSMKAAAIHAAAGRFDDAFEVIAADRHRLEISGGLQLLRAVDAADAELALAAGDARSAYRWADMTPVAFPGDFYRIYDHPVEAQARIWLRRRGRGDAEQAAAALRQLRDNEIAMHHPLALARTLPLLAGALSAAGKNDEAIAAMREALAIEPGIMTRRFHVAGPEAWLLLGRIASDGRDRFSVRASRVLDSAGQPATIDPSAPQVPPRRTRAGMRARAHYRLVVPGSDEEVVITNRQLEILRLLAQWKTDKEMAWELNLSPYTVSEHVQNLMRKLGASDRREVVSAAVALGLPLSSGA